MEDDNKMYMKKYKWLLAIAILLFISVFLIRYGLQIFNKNKDVRMKTEYVFTEVINLGCTSVKHQGISNTCWSYTGNSFLESEMIRMGKKPVPISPIFTARQAYLDRAQNYVQLHGGLSLGEGGQLHDVLNVLRKYGAMPRTAYSGLHGNHTYNDFKKMTPMLNALLKSLVKSKPLPPHWTQLYTAALDWHLGKVPDTFAFNGKIYTARSFADQVIGINPDDYSRIASVMTQPYYKPFVLLVPDNWSFDSFYNVPMQDLTRIIDSALYKGYTVAWTTDISDKGFSWPYGIAYVPDKSFDEMSHTEQQNMFKKPMSEKKITATERQQALDNWNTTDDHAMHIVGLAKDQNGKPYYLVKNSWGRANEYKGYMYVTKEFVRYKTITLMLHKDGLTSDFRSNLNIME